MQRCSGKTKAGDPCRAAAGSGGLCFFHANPDLAHTLGQLGGRKNRSKLPETPGAGSMSSSDVRDILVEAIRDVRSKKITPRTAGALAQLCNSLHRVLQTADVEDRFARIEEQLAEQAIRESVDTDPTKSRKCDESGGGMAAQPDNVDMNESADGAEGGSNGPDEEEKA